MQDCKRVNISVDVGALSMIDEEVKLLHTNRSQFITDACLEKIAERQQIEVMKGNPQAFRNIILDIAKNLTA